MRRRERELVGDGADWEKKTNMCRMGNKKRLKLEIYNSVKSTKILMKEIWSSS